MPPISLSTLPLRSTSAPMVGPPRPSSRRSMMPNQRSWFRPIPSPHHPLPKPLLMPINEESKWKQSWIRARGRIRYTEATFLTNMKVPTYIDNKHAIAHNKIMVIDKATVITGISISPRLLKQNNAENLLIIKSKDLAKTLY